MSGAAALAAMGAGKPSSYALREAAERGQSDKVRRELEKGVNVNDAPRTGVTALHRAAEKDRHQTIALLCTYGADLHAKTNASQDTPLHIAAWKGHVATIRELINHGADLKAENKMGWTPLNSALTMKRTKVAEMFIDWGAKPNDVANSQMRDMNLCVDLHGANSGGSKWDTNYDGIVDRDERIKRSQDKGWVDGLGLGKKYETKVHQRGARHKLADEQASDLNQYNSWRKGYDMQRTTDDEVIRANQTLEAKRKARQARRMDFQRVLGRNSADTHDSVSKANVKLQWQIKEEEKEVVHADIKLDVKTLFMQMDLDGSGSLDKDELGMLARQLGKRMSPLEIDEAMAEMDEDGGGEVEFPEFLSWWSEQARSESTGEFAKMLKYGTDLGSRVGLVDDIASTLRTESVNRAKDTRSATTGASLLDDLDARWNTEQHERSGGQAGTDERDAAMRTLEAKWKAEEQAAADKYLSPSARRAKLSEGDPDDSSLSFLKADGSPRSRSPLRFDEPSPSASAAHTPSSYASFTTALSAEEPPRSSSISSRFDAPTTSPAASPQVRSYSPPTEREPIKIEPVHVEIVHKEVEARVEEDRDFMHRPAPFSSREDANEGVAQKEQRDLEREAAEQARESEWEEKKLAREREREERKKKWEEERVQEAAEREGRQKQREAERAARLASIKTGPTEENSSTPDRDRPPRKSLSSSLDSMFDDSAVKAAPPPSRSSRRKNTESDAASAVDAMFDDAEKAGPPPTRRTKADKLSASSMLDDMFAAAEASSTPGGPPPIKKKAAGDTMGAPPPMKRAAGAPPPMRSAASDFE